MRTTNTQTRETPSYGSDWQTVSRNRNRNRNRKKKNASRPPLNEQTLSVNRSLFFSPSAALAISAGGGEFASCAPASMALCTSSSSCPPSSSSSWSNASLRKVSKLSAGALEVSTGGLPWPWQLVAFSVSKNEASNAAPTQFCESVLCACGGIAKNK